MLIFRLVSPKKLSRAFQITVQLRSIGSRWACLRIEPGLGASVERAQHFARAYGLGPRPVPVIVICRYDGNREKITFGLRSSPIPSSFVPDFRRKSSRFSRPALCRPGCRSRSRSCQASACSGPGSRRLSSMLATV